MAALGAAITAGFLYGATPTTKDAPSDLSKPKVEQGKHEKVDPIVANGQIFVDWPKPDVAIVFSGQQDGYLEPCGCAGLENQKGGLKRRFTFLKELRDAPPKGKGWPLVPIDAGGLERGTGVQAGRKLEFSYRALALMGYEAVGFGENDLKMDLLSILINVDEVPLVSANVAVGGFDGGYSKRYKIVNKGGMRIGITTVLGSKEVARLKNADLTLKDPKQAIPEIVADLVNAKCDQLVLVVNSSPDEAKDLARHFKDVIKFDWVVATHGGAVPPKEPVKIEGTDSYLIEVGEKGEYVVVVGFYKNGDPSFRYQRVPLDHRFADDAEIYKMQQLYQRQLQQVGLTGLGIKPTAHQSGRKFAGSKSCVDCHTKAAEVFENTPHAHSTETLANKTDPPRMHDPECLSCHVTGWEPQKYFPFETGFLSMEKTPDLVGNGCENCHGPAAKHAAVENGEIDLPDAERNQLRAALHLKIGENEGNKDGQVYKDASVVVMCMRCHDQDNSPDFDFQKYWPKVKHEGKD